MARVALRCVTRRSRRWKRPRCGMSGTEQDTRLAVCGFTVDGISVGGQQTCIIFPELKLAFDTGTATALVPLSKGGMH